MIAFEYILLTLTYTSLSISLFLQWICYKKNMENIEAIALTISFILLLISISVSPLFPHENTTTISTLLCMILVGASTFIETLSQPNQTISPVYKKIVVSIGIVLTLVLIIAKFFANNEGVLYIQYAIVSYLGLTVSFSMFIARRTKPARQFQHLHKSIKGFALIFLIIVPAFLISHYVLEIRLGFLLYIAFLALAIRNIHTDLVRLSLIKLNQKPQEQQFKNYGITQREQEIAELLLEGLTYQDIAHKLHISLSTVKTHTSNIYKKCSVKSRNELGKLIMN